MAEVVRIAAPMRVRVTYYDGMFTTECDEPDLVTEAQDIDAMVERVWALAPDLIKANGVAITPGALRLTFEIDPIKAWEAA